MHTFAFIIHATIAELLTLAFTFRIFAADYAAFRLAAELFASITDDFHYSRAIIRRH
jgi:hypothetical protein